MRVLVALVIVACGHAAAPGPPVSSTIAARAAPVRPGRVVVTDAQIELLPDVRFVGQSAVVAPETLKTLDAMVETLNADDGIQLVEVIAYGDDGAAEFQQLIGQQRAQVVVDYLVRHGVVAHRLRAKGIAHSPNGHLRVEFEISLRN